MEMLPDTVALNRTSYNTAASGGASTITLTPANARETMVIDWITWSYAAAPTAGALTITDTTLSTTLLSIDITAAGPAELGFAERGFRTPKGSTITVTLADGSQTKKLTVGYR